MHPYRHGQPMADDTEQRYRSIVAELATLLAREKLPGADAATIVSAAIQIAAGMYERFALPTPGNSNAEEKER